VEVHRFVRADDQAPSVRSPPDTELVVEHHQRVDLLAQVQLEGSGVARGGRLVDDARVQPLAEAVRLVPVGLEVDESAGDAGLLVEDHDVGGGQLGGGVERILGRERLPADHRDGGLRIKGHQLEAGAEVLDHVVDRVAAPRDDLVEVLRAIQDALHRVVAPTPIGCRHRPHGRVVGVDVGHGPQDRDRGEGVAGRHLEQVDGLHHRALGDGLHRDARRVARKYVDQPGREGAYEAPAAHEVVPGHPLVQGAGVGEVLLDHGPQYPSVQIARRTEDLRFEHPTRQDVGRGHAVDAVLHEAVAGSRIRSPVSTRKSMISVSATLSSGGTSVRGWTIRSRSSCGVANLTPRSRERCVTDSPWTTSPR
jgi:hypothetical protein